MKDNTSKREQTPLNTRDLDLHRINQKISATQQRCGGELQRIDDTITDELKQQAKTVNPDLGAIDNEPSAKSQKGMARIPECARDPEGDVYCGSHPYQPITRTLAAAAFRFDTNVIRSFATKKTDEFTKQENYWMVEFLARAGCSAALAELLSAGMPAVAPEAFGHESEYGLEPIWLDPGLYMAPDTFDMVLDHALRQDVPGSDLHDMIELGI